MSTRSFVEVLEKPTLKQPTAILGSPGLRSVGKVAVEKLIQFLKPKLFARLYSAHFPAVHFTRPSYAADPRLLGEGGVKVTNGIGNLPSVEFYYSTMPELVISIGYHANFKGQYLTAEQVLDFYEEMRVKRVVVLAGYGHKGDEVCCAGTDAQLMEEMKVFGLRAGYEGAFFGFSGLVFGLCQPRKIEGVCLFGRSEPSPNDPESPDPDAAEKLLMKTCEVIGIVYKTQTSAS